MKTKIAKENWKKFQPLSPPAKTLKSVPFFSTLKQKNSEGTKVEDPQKPKNDDEDKFKDDFNPFSGITVTA